MTMFRKLFRDESGATAIEYGLIAALIAVAIIGAATTVGTNLGYDLHDDRRQALNVFGSASGPEARSRRSGRAQGSRGRGDKEAPQSQGAGPLSFSQFVIRRNHARRATG